MSDPLADIPGFLASVGLFSALSDDDRRHLASVVEVVRAAPNSTVFSEGDPGDAMFVVVFGQVRVERVAPDGAAVELAVIQPRGVFGEMALYGADPRRSASVRVGNRAVVMLSIHRASFERLLREHVEIGLHMLAAQSRRLREANDRLVLADHEARKHAPSFEERVIEDYPHPIAQVFQDANALSDPRARLQRYLELFEVSLLYASAVARALYLHAGLYAPEIDRDIFLGARGQTLGQHVRSVRSVAKHLAETHGRGGLAADLHRWLVERRRNKQETLATIDRLLEHRNELKHGAESALDVPEIERMLGEFEPRVLGVLASMEFLRHHPLFYLDGMNFIEGTFRYSAQRCKGAFRTFRSEFIENPAPRELDRLYLLDPADHTLVPLFPWVGMFRCNTCGDRDIFFGRSVFPNRVEWIEFERGHTQTLTSVPPSLGALLEGCRDRIRGTPADLPPPQSKRSE